jgi:pyrroloquinoline quinone (PQQ) biosynthesis protein C
MNVQLDTKIVKALEPYLLLNHPFYRRWEAGALHRDELTGYAEQYRYFERMLPSFLEKLIDQLPDGPIRDAVGANLTDEVSPPSHLELFERFARFYDAGEAEISPAMRRLVDAYSMILAKGPASSLAGLWAYESQGANIADSKADGLVTHYGAHDDAVEFWSVHGSLEGDHARWTRDALQALHPDLGVAVDAVALIGSAWWSFLDEREALAA